MPFLKEKLEEKNLQNAGHQLGHVINRMFTVLEPKGMLRAGIEDSMLAKGFRPNDELVAEFVRTCRHTFFHGYHYIQRLEDLAARKSEATLNILLPKRGPANAETDNVSLYGFRPNTPVMFFLSPWEFVQEFYAHQVKPPSMKYKLSKWIHKPEPGSNKKTVLGIDFIINL